MTQGHESYSPGLVVADTGRSVHLVIDGKTLCGRLVDDRDCHDRDASVRVWASPARTHCQLCERSPRR